MDNGIIGAVKQLTKKEKAAARKRYAKVYDLIREMKANPRG